MRKVLITGASRGIGRACAERFAQAGDELVLICRRNRDMLEAFAEELTKRYGTIVRCHTGDVGDSDFVRSLFEEECGAGKSMADPQGKVFDVVVNNAGVSYVGLITDMTDEDYHRVMSTNLDGVFYICREAARFMLRSHSGRMINIASVWGESGASTEVVYSASKAGVIGLTRALAKELAPSGIMVNAVSCGLIDTDMNKCFSDDEMAAVVEDIPADRIGKPGEVAELVFQIAQAPSYMTGQTIRIDGGWI